MNPLAFFFLALAIAALLDFGYHGSSAFGRWELIIGAILGLWLALWLAMFHGAM